MHGYFCENCKKVFINDCLPFLEVGGVVIEDERSVTVCPYCGCTDVKEVEDDNTVRDAIDVRDVEESE